MTTPVVPGPQVIVNADGSWDLPCRMRFQNPLDIVNTGVGTITVLPATDGSDIATAIAQFIPLLGSGPPGFTPNLNTTVNLIELAPGASPPSGTPAASWLKTDPGNEATPPTWQLTLYIHRGNDGSFIMPLLQDLSDVVGALVHGATVIFDELTGKWHVQVPPVTQFAAATNLAAADGTVRDAQLGTCILGSANYPRQPEPRGGCVVNPATDGTTTIKLYARLGSATGPIIGVAGGVPGLKSPYWATLVPTAAAADPANRIASGAAATVYFMASETTGSPSNWSTTMADAGFSANGIPVLT